MLVDTTVLHDVLSHRPRVRVATRRTPLDGAALGPRGDHVALIAERVAAAQAGTNPYVITKLRSGWVVIGDVQFLPGYWLLLADPVVPSLNDLAPDARTAYLRDMGLVGDAMLRATDAQRINDEILGNAEPELHAHVFPRYRSESDERNGAWPAARRCDREE